MTKEEIKATKSVTELLRNYGVNIHHGRCKCFFHGGRNYNMSVNDKFAHCFKCGETVDVFGVVEFFEKCDFKKAFEILGGNAPVSAQTRYKARVEMMKQNQIEIAEKAYHRALDRWCAADYIKLYYEQTQDESIYPYYVIAMQNMSTLEQILSEKEVELFERKRNSKL